MSEILWQPPAAAATESSLARFTKRVLGRAAQYDELWAWSTENRGEFWTAVWEHCGVVASSPPGGAVGAEAMPGTEWFPGARLNFAENLMADRGDGPALIVTSETDPPREISWGELRTQVGGARRSLLDMGVEPGDRVAGLLPNGPEAVVAMLAAAAIGAIWSSCSPDFGPLGVIDRFGQIEPRVLITTDGYRYNGGEFDITPTVDRALEEIPAIESVVVANRIGAPREWDAIEWDQFVAGGSEPEFAQLPFDHPLYILYSSGTTGKPKSIVHGAGGTLLKHLCEHQLHCDLRPGDRLFWFTTCGWMMWNWLVSGLATGATLVLYDGSPSHPSLETLWRLAAGAGITHFGTSPKFLAANANAGLRPADLADLSAMRWLGSTGAPLAPEQFDWVYENVSEGVQLASVSGGTDIIGCFAAGVPTLPVRRGELQARALGMAVEAWNEDGEPVTGEKGELVCTRPFVSMPVSFWNDPGGTRYRDAYFSQHPGVWTHGDFIEIRPEGGVVIYGRSDTTLNRGGVRMGTAEIYRAVEPMPEIVDALVVGHNLGEDIEIVLFVVLSEGVDLSEVEAAIRKEIRSQASPRHVPDRIVAVDDIPYTISGKKVEKAVQLILEGRPVSNRDALANPEALDVFAGILD